MNLLSPECFTAAQKANLDALFGLANLMVEGLQKLVELNLQVARSNLAEGRENVLAALQTKDAQELVALQTRLAQPGIETIRSYTRELFAIATDTQAGFTKVAETQHEAYTRRVQALIGNVTQSAPAGSEAAVAALKSAITATSRLYETVHQTARQAIHSAESNFNVLASAASKATESTSGTATRAAKH